MVDNSRLEESGNSPPVRPKMASDQDIWNAIEEIRRKGRTINLFLPDTPENARTFWQEFNCRRCGSCCQGLDQIILDGITISPEETLSLSNLLNISRHQFKDKYTVTRDGNRFIKYPCPFFHLESKSCLVYEYRPLVCRTYPINITGVEQNLGKNLDGRPLLTASSSCRESCRAAFEILKRSRDQAARISKGYFHPNSL
jgi:Fe-S-cluster containining protein